MWIQQIILIGLTSKIDAKNKKNIIILNKIKNAEIIKYKKRTSIQKELLNLFNDLLKTILTNKILMPSKDDVNENENENENENGNENDSENGNDNDNVNENDNLKKKIYKRLFRWNNWQIKIVWRPNKISKKSKKFKWVLVYQQLWR